MSPTCVNKSFAHWKVHIWTWKDFALYVLSAFSSNVQKKKFNWKRYLTVLYHIFWSSPYSSGLSGDGLGRQGSESPSHSNQQTPLTASPGSARRLPSTPSSSPRLARPTQLLLDSPSLQSRDSITPTPTGGSTASTPSTPRSRSGSWEVVKAGFSSLMRAVTPTSRPESSLSTTGKKDRLTTCSLVLFEVSTASYREYCVLRYIKLDSQCVAASGKVTRTSELAKAAVTVNKYSVSPD